MKYSRGMSIKSVSGNIIDFTPEERKYLRFSINCPQCGQKNSFNVCDAALYNYQKEPGLPFWLVGCKNRNCDYNLVAEAYKGLLDYLEDLKKHEPLIEEKIRSACGQLDPPNPIDSKLGL